MFPPSPCGGEQRGFGGGAPISPVRSGRSSRAGLFWRSADQELSLRQLVLVRGDQGLVGRRFAAQPIATQLVPIEIDFAADQPVLPGRVDEEFVPQDFDLSVGVGESQVDELTL